MEISAIEFHLLPYQQFVTASFVHEDDGDMLRLAFSSHDIEITGRNLRELVAALQEFSVKCVRPTAIRYHALSSTESSVITKIRISSAV